MFDFLVGLANSRASFAAHGPNETKLDEDGS